MTQMPLELAQAQHDAQQLRIARVLDCLRPRFGPAAAITIRAIAMKTGVPYREVQDTVKHLVEERHVPIGSLWRRPYGYYIVTDVRDLERNAWQFLSRGVSSIKHGRAFLSPALAGPIVGQLDLFVTTMAPFLAQLEARLLAHATPKPKRRPRQ